MNVIYMWVLGMIFAFSATMANAQAVHGVLRVVKGDVQIKSAKTGQSAKARVGEKVFPKDTVITGKDARAKIVMVDNNEINVSPESQIEIQNYEYDPAAGKKDVLLNVIYGKVRSKVEQKYDGKTSKFQIKTPSAVAGVRGTDFAVGHIAGISNVVTFHGAVAFGPPGVNPVMVTPGMMANVTGGVVSPPAPVPKTELAKMDNDTKADGPKTTDAGGTNDNRQPSANEKKEEKKDEGKKDPAKQDGADKNKGSGNDKNGNNGNKGSDNRGSGGGDGGGSGGNAGGAAPGSPSAGGGSPGGGDSASNGGSPGGGTTPGGASNGGGRGPASNPTGPAAGGPPAGGTSPGPVAGGCTMCGGPPMPTLPPVMPTLPPTFVPPPIFTPPPVCTACIDIPQSGSSKLIIHVNTN